MKYTNKRNSRIPKKTLFWIIVVMVLLGSAIVYIAADRNWFSETKQSTSETEPNYEAPPTEQESNAGNDQKENIDDEAINQTDTAEVAIVDATQYEDVVEIRAFVQGVIEGGTCTATLTRGGSTVEKTADAFVDATTTQCGNLNIDRSEFPQSGEWKLLVSYTSDEATGTSEEWNVTIK